MAVLPVKTTRGPSYPIRVKGRLFEDQNGIPFFMSADTNWYLVDRLTKKETIQYLDDRRAKGFNAVIMQVMNRAPDATGSPANRDGDNPFTTANDFSTPNEAYFAHLDWVLRAMAARGIMAILFPCYVGYQFLVSGDGWGQQLLANSLGNCTAWGEYLGARYAPFYNKMWCHGGDAAAGDYSAMSRVDAIANGILAYDTTRPALHSAHSYRGRSAYDDYNRSWLQVNTTYASESTYLSKSSVNWDRYVSSALPFWFAEGRYENESGYTAKVLRGQVYATLCYGGSGHAFGNCPIWHSGAIYTWCNSSDWQGNLDATGSLDMARFNAFRNARPWYTTVPDTSHTVITAGYTGAAFCAGPNLCIGWVPDNARMVTIDLSKFAASSLRVRWFNPATAAFTEVATVANTGTQDTTPPTNADYVLVVEP